MSYITPSIGNRLGISFGWTTDNYPSLQNYAADVQNTVRLYWFIKEYFNKSDIMLIHYKYALRKPIKILYLAIYQYHQRFNMQTRRKKKRNLRRKKKWTMRMQSRMPEHRKRTKTCFIRVWRRLYRKLKTYRGWRAINKKISIKKHQRRHILRVKKFLTHRVSRQIGNLFSKYKRNNRYLKTDTLKKNQKRRRIWKYLPKQYKYFRMKKKTLRQRNKRRLRGWTFRSKKNLQLFINDCRKNLVWPQKLNHNKSGFKNKAFLIRSYSTAEKSLLTHVKYKFSAQSVKRLQLRQRKIKIKKKFKHLLHFKERLRKYKVRKRLWRLLIQKKHHKTRKQLQRVLQYKKYLRKRKIHYRFSRRLHKIKKKLKRLMRKTNQHCSKRLHKKKSFGRIRIYSPEFYNNYISMLSLRFRLRSFLKEKQFYITNVNITEPIKVASKKSIKRLLRSHWFIRLRKFLFFSNTIRLFHLFEKYPNATIIAEHFATELFNVRKKHWNLIRAFATILKYWRFHSGVLINQKELRRNRGKYKKNKQKIHWMPRYKLYSPHDGKKTIRGIKICVKGKINSKARARIKIIQEGIIPIQSFNQNVTYAIAHARVKTGAFGIKVWIFT